jgi:hypothetical protein
VSFAFTIAAALGGGRLRWWQIGLPALIIGNVAVTSLGVFQHSPRLRQAFFITSFGIALAVLAAILGGLSR